MEQSNAVFSALKAYDDHLWQRIAERPEIERVPFHLLDRSFLAQQSVRDLLSAERGIARLFSIATDEQKEILAPVSRQIETVLFNKEYMGAQSSQDLMDGKAFLLNEKMHHSEVEFHLKKRPTESSVKALQQRIDLIDDAGREKLTNPRASVLLSSTSAARAATPRDEEWVMISRDGREERAARKTHLQEARIS